MGRRLMPLSAAPGLSPRYLHAGVLLVRGKQGVELTEWESDGAHVLGCWQHHDDGVITARKAPCTQADRGQGNHERASHDSDPGVRSLCSLPFGVCAPKRESCNTSKPNLSIFHMNKYVSRWAPGVALLLCAVSALFPRNASELAAGGALPEAGALPTLTPGQCWYP